MSKPKHFRFRANVKDFVDADYLETLSPEDRTYYLNFCNEYYSNAVAKEDSSHREALEGKNEILCVKCQKTEDDFDRAKKATYEMNNGLNKDAYAISSTGTYLNFIESENFYQELVAPLKKEIDIIDPQEAFNILSETAVEELNDPNGRSAEIVLREISMEMVRLGASVTQARTQQILKKRRINREARNKRKAEKEASLKRVTEDKAGPIKKFTKQEIAALEAERSKK